MAVPMQVENIRETRIRRAQEHLERVRQRRQELVDLRFSANAEMEDRLRSWREGRATKLERSLSTIDRAREDYLADRNGIFHGVSKIHDWFMEKPTVHKLWLWPVWGIGVTKGAVIEAPIRLAVRAGHFAIHHGLRAGTIVASHAGTAAGMGIVQGPRFLWHKVSEWRWARKEKKALDNVFKEQAKMLSSPELGPVGARAEKYRLAVLRDELPFMQRRGWGAAAHSDQVLADKNQIHLWDQMVRRYRGELETRGAAPLSELFRAQEKDNSQRPSPDEVAEGHFHYVEHFYPMTWLEGSLKTNPNGTPLSAAEVAHNRQVVANFLQKLGELKKNATEYWELHKTMVQGGQ